MNLDQTESIFNEIFNRSSISNSDERYVKFGLKFNPFPRSGTTNINSSDIYNRQLIPVDKQVQKKIADFITHSLVDNPLNPEDKFLCATITGDYGSGKTQLLMFVKYLLGEVSIRHEGKRNPYVIYIDNPGVSLSELIGAIISKIGEDDFKKYLWAKVIKGIKSEHVYRESLAKFEGKGVALFLNVNPDPYAEENTTSYKKFLNSFLSYQTSSRQRKDFDLSFREVLIKVLESEVRNGVLAQYFYQLISEDYGVNKTWESLSSGSIKQLDGKEADIIRYIVQLTKEQGYTDFFILVDEFEDITEGRLSKSQVDNYVYNLRTLLDEHRSWSLIFAMTGQALRKLRSVSPPLADRISTRLIVLQKLSDAQAMQIVLNYQKIALNESVDGLGLFEESAILKLNELVEGNSRKFLKNCYYLVEKGVELLEPNSRIDADFVSEQFQKDF